MSGLNQIVFLNSLLGSICDIIMHANIWLNITRIKSWLNGFANIDDGK